MLKVHSLKIIKNSFYNKINSIYINSCPKTTKMLLKDSKRVYMGWFLKGKGLVFTSSV